jgi:hypothetical protein
MYPQLYTVYSSTYSTLYFYPQPLPLLHCLFFSPPFTPLLSTLHSLPSHLLGLHFRTACRIRERYLSSVAILDFWVLCFCLIYNEFNLI